MHRIVALVLVACLAAGCASTGTAVTSQDVRVIDDPFKPDIEYDAPEIGGFFMGVGLSYFLRGYRPRKVPVLETQLYVSAGFRGDWCLFNSLTFVGGEELPDFTSIDRSVGSCDENECFLYEEFAAVISPDRLTQGLRDGQLQVAANSQRACQYILTLPAGYILAYLQAAGAAPEHLQAATVSAPTPR